MQVCELHFKPEDIRWETSYFDQNTGRKVSVRLEKPYLHDGAVPSLLPGCPSYLSKTTRSRESPDSKRKRIEESALQAAFAQSAADHENYWEEKKFSTIDELLGKLDSLDRSYWSVIKQEENLLICHIIYAPHPKLIQSLLVKADCKVHAFTGDVQIQKIGDYAVPSSVTDINVLEHLLGKLRTLDTGEQKDNPPSAITVIQLVLSFLSLLQDQSFKHIRALKFVCEQLYLMTLTKLNYSSELMVFASLLYHCSPQGYRLLRDTGTLILPNYTSLRKLTLSVHLNPALEQNESHFLMYIKQKFKLLSTLDKTVTLMLDEIHLKPYFDYKGGNVVGSAFNSTEAATSAFVFMINSICSTFKEVVHIIPTKLIKAETLHSLLKQVIIGLEEIGFKVICVVTDNNAINKKALSFFASPPTVSIVYPHPAQSSRPLFFLFDSVHILKCIRNNWLNKKNADRCMTFPQFNLSSNSKSVIKILNAPFATLQKLYTLEAESLLKHSYKLTLKALSPSNLERQNVNLVLQIFNEYIIEALITFGKTKCLPLVDDVAEYIKIFCKWWDIMNVKTPFKGCRLKKEYATPLTDAADDEKYVFLNSFCDWLEMWDSMKNSTGKLTKETFAALKHTTHAMVELTSYCINELKLKYVLPGKFQTDNLEARFGKYRQLAGAQYNISVRQMFECEKKLRMMSVLHQGSINLKNLGETNWEGLENQDNLRVEDLGLLDVTREDTEKCKDVLAVITYLAGYCCYAVCKKMKCLFCKDIVTCTDLADTLPENHSYIQGLSRGSLLYPDDITTNIVMYNYIIINKLAKNPLFIHSMNQRNLATELTLNALAEDDALFHSDVCGGGHSTEKVEKMIIWASTNALLNNFCARENNSIVANKDVQKNRKLKTLMK